MKLFAFTGIHVLSPTVVKAIPAHGFADIIDRYRECIAQGISIHADIVTNHFWTDMGTESDYLWQARYYDKDCFILPFNQYYS